MADKVLEISDTIEKYQFVELTDEVNRDYVYEEMRNRSLMEIADALLDLMRCVQDIRDIIRK